MTEHQTSESHPTNIHFYDALGMMMWLMKHADYHSQWPLWSVDVDVMPALIHGQSKIYFDDQQNPVGFATWAWLNDHSKRQILETKEPLALSQWNDGEYPVVIDFLAPWGHAKNILGDLKHNVFSDKKVLGIRRHIDGSIRKVCYWRGRKCNEGILKDQQELNKKLLASGQ